MTRKQKVIYALIVILLTRIMSELLGNALMSAPAGGGGYAVAAFVLLGTMVTWRTEIGNKCLNVWTAFAFWQVLAILVNAQWGVQNFLPLGEISLNFSLLSVQVSSIGRNEQLFLFYLLWTPLWWWKGRQ